MSMTMTMLRIRYEAMLASDEHLLADAQPPSPATELLDVTPPSSSSVSLLSEYGHTQHDGIQSPFATNNLNNNNNSNNNSTSLLVSSLILDGSNDYDYDDDDADDIDRSGRSTTGLELDSRSSCEDDMQLVNSVRASVNAVTTHKQPELSARHAHIPKKKCMALTLTPTPTPALTQERERERESREPCDCRQPN
jgi:hypothetical protein